ncbi:SusC/RagA family TonB-linked outer membrane protein [Mongoliibacter sp.]|uniref:SusC/RagA family TonB-linked outer membrane protein n=1 Tax=Mongoliibacter sp. TaxID=2022438 RepID=UPI0025FB3AD8|nr:SusC/RagA family TonB-linked outer membrane protein [Mongoliibacter sp.]
MKYKYLHIMIFFAIISLFGIKDGKAQQGRSSGGQELNINATIVNSNGEAIHNATVTLGEGLLQAYSNEDGEFSIKATTNNVLIISARGYEEKVINLRSTSVESTIVLTETLVFDSRNDVVNLPTGISTTQRQLVGSVDIISGSEIESQPDIVLSNALQGRLAGLTVRMNEGGLGNNVPTLAVRGLSRLGGNAPVTIVDGIERPIEFLVAEEIESIEVLKDASAKILYGPRAANGVILVTTKRGRENTRVIKASVEYGVTMTTRMPEYLGSAEYATLYNEARQNDGFSPFYSEQQIEGYRQSTGENDLLYPDADYVNYFLRNSNPFRKANVEYSGGNEDARYAFMVGYIGTEGVEKVGNTPKEDRINIRGNLDIKVTDKLSAFIDGNGIIESRRWGKLNQDAVFSAISSHRPNEYPFVIDDPNFEGADTPLGQERIPPQGGSYIRPNSLYGNMVYGGFQEHQYFYGQTNFGLNLKLDDVLDGLSAKSYITFDNYQFQSASQINNPIRYGVFPSDDGVDYVQLQNRVISGNRTEQGNNISRNTGWITNLNYDKVFEKHAIKANLSHFYYLNENSDRRQNIENTNTFLRTVYSFDNRFYFEATGAVMGSNRFAKENRFKFFPAVGASWIISEESFMNSTSIDFLKVKGSFGILGYDAGTSFYLYDTRYFNNGSVQFNERNQNNVQRTGFDNFGNPDLEWETSREVNIGIEGFGLNNSLRFEVNYFNEFRDNIIFDNPGALFSSINGNLNVPQNWGQVSNQGVDASINYIKSFGDLSWSVGGNFLYVKNEVLRTNEVFHPDEYLRQTGRPSDAIFGYVSNGIFRDQSQVDGSPFQALGPYGVGNLSYEDLNGDGIIDERDVQAIGNSFPRTTLGVNFSLNYKGFGLFVLGTSELGVHTMRNNSYYRNSGEGKYSAFVRDRFHPENNPGGSVPALTTLGAVNDFRGSTFWLEDASFFRLKNVELSYSLANAAWTVKNIRLFVRATNVFVISAIKELDPEALNAGVTNYPIFRTVTSGVAVSF